MKTIHEYMAEYRRTKEQNEELWQDALMSCRDDSSREPVKPEDRMQSFTDISKTWNWRCRDVVDRLPEIL